MQHFLKVLNSLISGLQLITFSIYNNASIKHNNYQYGMYERIFINEFWLKCCLNISHIFRKVFENPMLLPADLCIKWLEITWESYMTHRTCRLSNNGCFLETSDTNNVTAWKLHWSLWYLWFTGFTNLLITESKQEMIYKHTEKCRQWIQKGYDYSAK